MQMQYLSRPSLLLWWPIHRYASNPSPDEAKACSHSDGSPFIRLTCVRKTPNCSWSRAAVISPWTSVLTYGFTLG